MLSEREGFEPPESARTQRFSRPPLSTAQPSLHHYAQHPYTSAKREYNVIFMKRLGFHPTKYIYLSFSWLSVFDHVTRVHHYLP